MGDATHYFSDAGIILIERKRCVLLKMLELLRSKKV